MFDAFFDSENKNGVIEKSDISYFLEKMRVFRDFDNKDSRNLKMQDVVFAFYDCLMETVKHESQAAETNVGFKTWNEALKPHVIDVNQISLNQWLNMWGRLCRGAAGISGFPYWVQLLAHIFFDAIDHDSDGQITYEELQRFYSEMIGIKGDELEKLCKEGYRAMTAVRISISLLSCKKMNLLHLFVLRIMPTPWIESNICSALPIFFWVETFMALANTFLESLTIVKCPKHSKSSIMSMKWTRTEKFLIG